MRIILISTYDLGHQPFGLASPAAWLRRAGHQVTCVDLSRQALPRQAVVDAELAAFYLPMHAATRLALRAIPRVRALNAGAFLCCYGLYAPMNENVLCEAGVASIIGGEFEGPLVELAAGLEPRGTQVSLSRQKFLPPDRAGLPPLAGYAGVRWNGTARVAGYTEASRGCKHLCRHCPIVPVYNGVFRIVEREVVLEDVRRQVAAGAEHITFGDPDFLNGPGHAAKLVEAFHQEFPLITYDATIKIEHLLRHRGLLPLLQRTGCLFVTSAVESIDNAVLEKLDKGHTRADFMEAVRLMREAGLHLAPTFVPFTPWTTWESYRDLLRTIADLGLVENVAPIQLAIRLLIPAGSRLLELPELRTAFDARALVHPWRHQDPSLDRLAQDLQELIKEQDRRGASRTETFAEIWKLAKAGSLPVLPARATIPYLTEPWYC